MLASGTAIADSNRDNPGLSYLQLAQASATEKQDGQYWIKKGWEFHSAGKYEQAIQAFRKAEAMGAGSDDLTFDIANTYEEMGRNRDAYWEFNKAKDSKNHTSRATACKRTEDLVWARDKVLPDPYFADLYTNGGWQSIGKTAFLDMRGRIGIERGGDLPTQYYLFGRYTRDNRSGNVGGFPEEYYNNAAIIGIGLQKKVLTNHEMYFKADAGRAKELVDVGRNRYENDFRAGFEYYRNWNTDLDCRSTNKFPNRFIMKTYSELTYYSRFDHSVWFNAKIRPGLRIYETPKSTVDVFLVFSINANLKENNDNYNEAGLQLEWYPSRSRDFSISAKAVETFFNSGGSDFNFIIEFEHNILW